MVIQKTILILLLLLSFSAKADSPLECLAKNIYFESRNQPWVGKLAVAQVTLNRVADSRFPDSICDVVKQQKKNTCQFSWYCDGLSDTPHDVKEWKQSLVIAIYSQVAEIPDVTEGSLWYHATYIDPPYWARVFTKKLVIQDHIFYGTR